MSRLIRSRAVWMLAAAVAMLSTAAPSLMAQATGTVRGTVVETVTQRPLAGARISIVGSNQGVVTSATGEYALPVPPGRVQIRASMLGHQSVDATVTVAAGQSVTRNFALETAALALDAIVVSALGQTTTQRAVATAQQTVRGAEIAETQRENFVNALQGRVAGVEVISTSGVPGASSQITIRGVSSISGNNQPLMIIDGLPVDNKTLNASGGPSNGGAFVTDFANRGVDFTNRAADINPEDIETLVVLKGPEASALYGIDAANGAIVITTKRGKAGTGGLEYNNSFRIESTRARPEIQQVYGVSAVGSSTFLYWGNPYSEGTQLYDNVNGFFQTALTQKHNLSFSGAAADNRINYRLATSLTDQNGIVPGSTYDRINLTGASQGQVNRWLNVDLSMNYTFSNNDQPFKGTGGPLIGLLVWPSTDNASDYLTQAGTRRRLTDRSLEVDNPYFNVEKNSITSRNNRIIANLGFVLTPFSWGNLRTNLGTDSYTNQNQILRHPESTFGSSVNGVLDAATDVTRNNNAQAVLNFNRQPLTGGLSISGLLGSAVNDYRSHIDAIRGQDFLEPDFVSVNNALLRTNQTTITQRRLLSAFGSATLDYNRYLYLTVTGRNDWTSTIPKERNSFFYPSVSSSFIFSDAFPAIGDFMTGKLRAAFAQVGRDARPYAYESFLVSQNTSYGGYGYGFWGPNPGLRPEFAQSYEFGTELGFFDDRLGIDATVYRKETTDQIVNDIRGSYSTGFILLNVNGASTRNEGLEVTLRGTPVLRDRFSWDFLVNFDRSRGRVLALPRELPEAYNSDTWLYGNVRAGNRPGLSTRSITGRFNLRNDRGDLLIDPTTGLPIVSPDFIDRGYDRQPDFTVGVNNTLRYGRASLSFLVDIRKGGDVLNATEHFLTARGLSMRTLDREQPRVIQGVLRDGKENSDNPTPNNIVVVPAVNNNFYLAMSEELFIEKDINWLRLRDVTLRFGLPQRFGKNSSVFVTGTDLYLLTNYSGLDPVVSGNTAAVGGSGGMGIDYGNFPMPRGINFGIRTSF